jgi:signal transduction histidine kinase
MLAGIVLLVRAARLFHALVTVGFGMGIYRRVWVAPAAFCLAFGWSCFLAWVAVRKGRITAWLALGDTAVAMAVLLTVGMVTPSWLLTTSFYWAMPFTQSAAMVPALAYASRKPWIGLLELGALVLTYWVVVDLGAGARALPAAVGNAAGIAGFFAVSLVVTLGVRRFSQNLDKANEQAHEREAKIQAQRVRLAEFRRLHDDAVQVLERTASTDQPYSPQLQAYSRRAAERLHATIENRRDAPGSLLEALHRVVDDFDRLGFEVEVACTIAPDFSDAVCSVVTDAIIEALTNARKHSGTTKGWVRVGLVDRGLEVSVADHGVGFDPLSVGTGFGLANSIHGRLREAGGAAEIQSAVGAGTVVKMWLPC